jgi:catechol 2,3-dioxygenase-like lactoylglutathione lyase family enzyme
MRRAMPVLEVAHVMVSERFYCECLGFHSHGRWGDPPTFVIVQRGLVTLALDKTRNADRSVPLNQYWAAYLYVDDADALLHEFRAAGVDIARDIEDAPYGLRDFDVRDPDGHLLGIGHMLNGDHANAGLMPTQP